jgi:alpha-tubulin suppressor-like RCC1 family protein
LFLFGNNSDGQLGRSIPDGSMGPLEISLPDPIHSVACGNEYTVILTDKGDVYTCGMSNDLFCIRKDFLW